MKASSTVFGERFPHQAAAVFDTEQEARQAAAAVQAELGLDPSQVRVFRPEDAAAQGKLNSRRQSPGIARTLVKSHLVLGAVGAGAGLIVAMGLLWMGFGAFVASPVFGSALVVFLGLIAGLLLGGLVSMRPDQDVFGYRLEAAMTEGSRWAVVVRARDHGEEIRAGQTLQAHHGELVAAL